MCTSKMEKTENVSFENTKQCKPETPLGSSEDVKQWEEVRCPICMEHPHNAVLLRCSSYDNGCRPFMCNTSCRHSNCLDQFCKSIGSSPSNLTIQHSRIAESGAMQRLTCPLCRGEICGWFVVDAARKFMNAKVRSCSCENCDFSGNYFELRNHARFDHPTVRPVEVAAERQRNWERLELETEMSNLPSLITFMMGGEEEELESTSSLFSQQLRVLRLINQVLEQLILWRIQHTNNIDDNDEHATFLLDWMFSYSLRVYRNNYRHNGSPTINLNSRTNNRTNSFNSRQNISFRTNSRARMARNLLSYERGNLSNHPNSRRNIFGRYSAERMRLRRINNARHYQNISRRSVIDRRRSRR